MCAGVSDCICICLSCLGTPKKGCAGSVIDSRPPLRCLVSAEALLLFFFCQAKPSTNCWKSVKGKNRRRRQLIGTTTDRKPFVFITSPSARHLSTLLQFTIQGLPFLCLFDCKNPFLDASLSVTIRPRTTSKSRFPISVCPITQPFRTRLTESVVILRE